MTQPSFVPIAGADQVRPSLHLEMPRAWVPDRPAELRVPLRPGGRGRGTPGPDQGFALRLASRFEDRIRLVEGESAEDVLLGVALVASRRAALFGRAPTVYDLDRALSIWGFCDEPSGVDVDARRATFSGAAHDYDVQRAIVDSVPDDVLALPAGGVRA